uniref:Uncharacterized protein n=1 Tax=Cannabis sativa TaxID=3483 RepID=A0A803PZW6_CANSA
METSRHTKAEKCICLRESQVELCSELWLKKAFGFWEGRPVATKILGLSPKDQGENHSGHSISSSNLPAADKLKMYRTSNFPSLRLDGRQSDYREPGHPKRVKSRSSQPRPKWPRSPGVVGSVGDGEPAIRRRAPRSGSPNWGG